MKNFKPVYHNISDSYMIEQLFFYFFNLLRIGMLEFFEGFKKSVRLHKTEWAKHYRDRIEVSVPAKVSECQ